MTNKKIAFQLRVDKQAHAKLQQIAEKELRSLNAQIEYFIAKGIERYEQENGAIDVPCLNLDEPL